MAGGASDSATLRLNLDDGEFLLSLRKVGEGLKKTSGDGEKQFHKLGKGIEAARKSLGSLGGSLKNAIGLVGGLGGAFSVMKGAEKAVALDATYRRLAFSLSVATREQHDAAEVQKTVQDAAGATTRTSEEMAGAFKTVFGATKDLQFTRDMMEAIGVTANATGAEVETVATLAQQMQRKFGLSAAQSKQALGQLFEQAQQGGPSFEQMSQIMDEMGATMLRAGFEGKRGLDFVLGAINATDGAMGGLGNQVSGIKSLMSKMGDPHAIQAIAKAAGLASTELFNEKDSVARIRRVLAQGTKGVKALEATLVRPEQLDALRILFTQPFDDALKRAHDSGLKGRDAVEQSMRVLDDRLGKFGESVLDYAGLQKEAAKEAMSPQANMRKSMEALTQAMGSEEITSAITELSKVLPDLAKLFGNAVSWAAKNPILAGALGIGGRVGASFFAGAAREAGSELVAKFGGKLTTHAATFATQAGKQLATVAGGPFGKVAGVAIAGAVAYAVKQAIDEAFGKAQAGQREDVAAAVGGGRPTTEEGRQKALARAKGRLAELEKGRGAFDVLLGGITQTNEMQDRDRATRRQLLRERIAELEGLGAIGAGGASAPGATATARPAPKVGLDSHAPELIATAIANKLKGTTLSVAMSTHGGVPAMSVGGRGPRIMPAVQQGGGL